MFIFICGYKVCRIVYDNAKIMNRERKRDMEIKFQRIKRIMILDNTLNTK